MARWTTKDLDAIHLEWDAKGDRMSEVERRDLFVGVMGANLRQVGLTKRVHMTLCSQRKSRHESTPIGLPGALWPLLLDIAAEEERFLEWLAQHPDSRLHDRVEVAGAPSERLIEENLETLRAYLRHRGPAALHSLRFRRHLERECGFLDKDVELDTTRSGRTSARRDQKAALAAFQKAEFDKRKRLVAEADTRTIGLRAPAEIAHRLRETGLIAALMSGDYIPQLIAWGRRPRRGRNKLPVETIAMASLILSSCSLTERPPFDELEVLAVGRIRKMRGDLRSRSR